jgi:hypothetical protein
MGNDKRARDNSAASIDKQVHAAKWHRSTALAVAHAASVIAFGRESDASDADRLLGVDAFVTLAKLGAVDMTQAEQLCRLFDKFSYLSDDAWVGLTNIATSLCGRISAIDSQLVHTLLAALLSHPPSPSVWPFVAPFSAHCGVPLPPAVREAYNTVLRETASKFIEQDGFAAGQALLTSLCKTGFDIDWRNTEGDTQVLERVREQGYFMELQALIAFGATLWVSNSHNQQTVLHIWMGQKRFDIVRDILLERPPWDVLLAQLDWWAQDNAGHTPLQIAVGSWVPASELWPVRKTDQAKATMTVIDMLRALEQHWKQTERPLLVQSLLEHASLCTDVAQLVLSYVDGQERA